MTKDNSRRSQVDTPNRKSQAFKSWNYGFVFSSNINDWTGGINKAKREKSKLWRLN